MGRKHWALHLFFPAFIALFGCRQQSSKYNLDLHQIQGTGWDLGADTGHRCHTVSIVKTNSGYNQLVIKTTDSLCSAQGIASYSLPAFPGSKLELSAFLEAKDVIAGEASLFIEVYGENGSFEGRKDLKEKSLMGSVGRKKYSVELDYESDAARSIVVGIVLNGKGKVIADNFELRVDGEKIDNLEPSKLNRQDSIYSTNSGLSAIALNKDKIDELATLGEIWGFLKYYHPLVATGSYNWDAKLFHFLPSFLNAKSKDDANNLIEKWIAKLDSNYVYDSVSQHSPSEYYVQLPDINSLLFSNRFSKTLAKKLRWIYDNYNGDIANGQYYVKMNSRLDIPVFINEISYSNTTYPDVGVRLLSLYRYWNYIKYFYPYRSLLKNWEATLAEFIPKFVDAKNSEEYVLCCLELVGRIQDSHSGIWMSPSTDSIMGRYLLPAGFKIVEDKLVVMRYYDGAVSNDYKIGDVILKIDGVPVDTLVKHYLKYTPGSNYPARLRDVCRFLYRTKKKTVDLLIESANGSVKQLLNVPTLTLGVATITDTIEAFKILSRNIGYLRCSKLKYADVPVVKNAFQDTKGIIFDLRAGNGIDMVEPFSNWLKTNQSPYCKFYKSTLSLPGAMVEGPSNICGVKNAPGYKGKIIILVNSNTQSSGECTSMALRTFPNSMIVGSQTAGADGVVTGIILPGGFKTFMTASGIYYPDGTETQRVGVKIDKIVTPTIKGIREGRDELLDAAIQLINEK